MDDFEEYKKRQKFFGRLRALAYALPGAALLFFLSVSIEENRGPSLFDLWLIFLAFLALIVIELAAFKSGYKNLASPFDPEASKRRMRPVYVALSLFASVGGVLFESWAMQEPLTWSSLGWAAVIFAGVFGVCLLFQALLSSLK